jgi:hypothetical protein
MNKHCYSNDVIFRNVKFVTALLSVDLRRVRDQRTVGPQVRKHDSAKRLHMKMTVFWDVAPCSLVEVYCHFRDVCCCHQKDHPDDGGNTLKCW